MPDWWRCVRSQHLCSLLSLWRILGSSPNSHDVSSLLQRKVPCKWHLKATVKPKKPSSWSWLWLCVKVCPWRISTTLIEFYESGSYVAFFSLKMFSTAVNSPSIRPLKASPRSVSRTQQQSMGNSRVDAGSVECDPASCTSTTTLAATATARWGRGAVQVRGAAWQVFGCLMRGLQNGGLKTQGLRIIRGPVKVCVYSCTAKKKMFWKAVWHSMTTGLASSAVAML